MIWMKLPQKMEAVAQLQGPEPVNSAWGISVSMPS